MHVASVSLLIILACGTGLLILVQDRWVELLGLIGLEPGMRRADLAADRRKLRLPTSAHDCCGRCRDRRYYGDADRRHPFAQALRRQPSLEWQPNLQVWRLLGAALLIMILVAAPPLGIAPMLEAAYLLLVGGTVICLTLDRQQRAGGGLVILLLGFHLLYLAMTLAYQYSRIVAAG